ncbi:MAG TPA: hypothetical protein VMF91_22410 [Bryobacteraceae bacterium]|nr:hypothetical protein [Bryobacteraceae bacterium]HTW23802.1 hypothetical protein [Candidatus Baltobacteraceae bacterium]
MTIFTVEAAWPASHVVVAKETSTPGKFEVVWCWKGNLPKGETIDVPEMIPLQAQSARVFRNREGKPERLRPSELVLFLRESPTAQSGRRRLAPVDSEMRASMAWMQDDEMFCFRPDNESVEVELVDSRLTWAEMWMAVKDVTHEQTLLGAVSRVTNKRARAEELAPFLLSAYQVSRSYAFKQLEACGRDGVPTLVAILNDPALMDRQADAMKALVAVEGKQAGPELTALLDSDVEFWTAVGPALKTGWWDEDMTPEAPLRLRLGQTVDIIRALDGTQFPGARKSVIALRDLWSTIPPIDSRGDTGGIVDECNRFLNALPADRAN